MRKDVLFIDQLRINFRAHWALGVLAVNYDRHNVLTDLLRNMYVDLMFYIRDSSDDFGVVGDCRLGAPTQLESWRRVLRDCANPS
jgi:hypothetical protein